MSNQCLDHLLLLICKRPVHQRFRTIHPSLHSSIHLYQPSINPYVRRPCTHTLIHPSTTIHPPIYNSTSIHPFIRPNIYIYLPTQPTTHSSISHPSTHSYSHPSTGICTSVHPLNSFKYASIHSTMHPFIQLCIHSVIYASIHPPSH